MTNIFESANPEEYINTVSVFSGVKKHIHCDNFKGGQIINVFGSTELDLTESDIKGVAVIDCSQAFGEISIIVPPNWKVVNDLSELLAKLDDKRPMAAIAASDEKVLVLKGVSICAAVVIVSGLKSTFE